MFSMHTWGRNLVMSDSREWLEFGVYLTWASQEAQW